MDKSLQFEICVDSVQSAINAQIAGAHRVELCDNLFEGGTTPSAGMIKQVKQQASNIQLFVIIRPRGGDFLYSEEEINVMLADIEIAKQFGADGIVSGCLLENGEIDVINTKKLITACGQLPFTFHRAFDMCSKPEEAIEQLIQVGAQRILTSGLQQTAHLGRKAINQFIKIANKRIIILVGSGVKPDNIAQIAKETNAHEFHFSGRIETKSNMKHKNTAINMGGISGLPEFNLYHSDVDVIKRTINAVKKIYM